MAALEQSLNEIIRRHETLRTTFMTAKGQPSQVVSPPAPFPLSVVDLRECSSNERDAEVMRLATAAAQQPFDLACGPLFRPTLLLGESEHVLLLVLHHIISDGWSTGILLRELAALYTAYATGRPVPLPALPIQFADFAQWQRQWLQGRSWSNTWRTGGGSLVAASPPWISPPIIHASPSRHSEALVNPACCPNRWLQPSRS